MDTALNLEILLTHIFNTYEKNRIVNWQFKWIAWCKKRHSSLEGTEKDVLQKGLWQLSQSKDIDIVRYLSIFSILREMFVRIVGFFRFYPSILTILLRFAAKIAIAPCISIHESPYDKALSYPNTFFNSEFFASILYRSFDSSLKRSDSWNFIWDWCSSDFIDIE